MNNYRKSLLLVFLKKQYLFLIYKKNGKGKILYEKIKNKVNIFLNQLRKLCKKLFSNYFYLKIL